MSRSSVRIVLASLARLPDPVPGRRPRDRPGTRRQRPSRTSPPHPGPTGSPPVAVVHGDLDVAGAALVLRLKEILNESSLFRLTDKDEKKLKIIVESREEFPGRPGIASAYSAIWVYSASENILTHYLDSEVGFVAPDGAAVAAQALATATDDVASRYAYLFE